MNRLVMVAFVFVVLCFSPKAWSAEILRVAVGDPEHSEQGTVAKAFKQYVEEKSQGKYQVDLFFASSYADELGSVQQIIDGTLDLSVVGVANIVPYAHSLGILTLPYLFDNVEQVRKATDGAGAKLLNSYAIDEGLRILAWTYTGFRYISNAKRPIKKIDDIKGLKIRVPRSAIIIASYTAFGATPVPVAWSETYTALKQGSVDGQCYGYIGFKAMNFFDVKQKYLTEVKYTYQLQPLIVSESIFKKMTKEDQKLLVDAGKHAQEVAYTYAIAEADKVKKELVAMGLQVTTLQDEAVWKKNAMELVWPEMAEYVGGKAAINTFLKATGRPAWN